MSTKSIGISPYSLLDPFRQSSLYHEYILIGPGIKQYPQTGEHKDAEDLDIFEEAIEEEEEIQLVLYDEDALHAWHNDPNIVQQNLGKAYLWAMIKYL